MRHRKALDSSGESPAPNWFTSPAADKNDSRFLASDNSGRAEVHVSQVVHSCIAHYHRSRIADTRAACILEALSLLNTLSGTKAVLGCFTNSQRAQSPAFQSGDRLMFSHADRMTGHATFHLRARVQWRYLYFAVPNFAVPSYFSR